MIIVRYKFSHEALAVLLAVARGSDRMDYYQGVVIEYLRADRALFVNTEYCIQINPGDNPDGSGPHWYCDAVAADFKSKTIFLCEISYSASLHDLAKRLGHWNEHWQGVCYALVRDSNLPTEWTVRPWIFVPQELVERLQKILKNVGSEQTLHFTPRVTPLEMVQPWNYCSWNRKGEKEKREVPAELRD